ncbi:winged helix-turn-helix domain-containing protein [Streptomyces sp. NPDC005385]|uniref:helix-turn-helix domain-containing protein n=1 Tax=Streptomyces sp. NPDC005385 TaxID=3157039 RepID=UPI0033A8F341
MHWHRRVLRRRRQCPMSGSPNCSGSWRGSGCAWLGGPAWTLGRIRALIWWKFEVDCSSVAVWRLPRRHGWSWKSPARRAVERDEDAVGLWKEDV